MSKVLKTITGVATAVSLFLASPVSALAAVPTQQDINLKDISGNFNVLTKLSAGGIVSGLIKFILAIAALLFFFMLVVGGIQWIVSGGDKAGSENARKKITSALVGLAIVFAAWAIASLIGTLFGIDIFNLNFQSIVPTS